MNQQIILPASGLTSRNAFVEAACHLLLVDADEAFEPNMHLPHPRAFYQE